MLILKEHDLDDFIKEEVKEPEGEEENAKHKNDMIKVKMIIYLIPSRISGSPRYLQRILQKKCLLH